MGCDECHHGYKGRIPIHEVLLINTLIRDAITENMRKDELRELVYSQDVASLLQDGLEKVEKGLTTVEELLKLIDLENDETNKENIIGLKESLKLAEEHKKEEIEEDKEKETSKKSVAKEAKPQEKESVKEENKPKQEAKENLEEDEDLLDALKSLNIDFPINPDKQEETDEDELFDRTGEIEDILADIDLSDADGLSEDDLRDLLK